MQGSNLSPAPRSSYGRRWFLAGLVFLLVGAVLLWRLRSTSSISDRRGGGLDARAGAGTATGSVELTRESSSAILAAPPVGPSSRASTNERAPASGVSSESARLLQVLEKFESALEPNARAEVVGSWVAGLSGTNREAQLRLLLTTNLAQRGETFRRALLRRWGESDSQGALAFLGSLTAGPLRAEAYGEIAGGWARRDAEAALAWARQVGPAAEHESAVLQAGYETARQQPMLALTAAVELPETPSRNDLLAYAANQWATAAPEAAVEWANRIPDVATRSTVLSQVLATWGDTDPAAAATAAVRDLPTGRAQNDAVVSIVQHWVQQDPHQAAAWVRAFPSGELAASAARELVLSWTEQDREQPGNWLNQLPAGGVRDSAVSAYVSRIVLEAPQSAAMWAIGIGDEARRQAELERVAVRWLEVDGAAAREWLNQAPLSETAKRRLMATPPPAQSPAP